MYLSSDWLTRAEAAAYCRVHVHTIDRWRRNGLPAGGSRGRRLFQRADLDAYLRHLGTQCLAIAMIAALFACMLLVVTGGCAAHRQRSTVAVDMLHGQFRNDVDAPPIVDPVRSVPTLSNNYGNRR